MLKVPLLFEGGSSAFWSLIYTSRITCPDDLLDRTTIVQPDSSVVALCPGLDLTALLTNWIRGQGIPCPGLFEEFVTSFDSIIDLTTLDSPGFRARMLCWAATGSPSLEIGSDGLYVSHRNFASVIFAHTFTDILYWRRGSKLCNSGHPKPNDC